MSAPLPADPLAPYTVEEHRVHGDLDCVIVTGPAIGRIKMPRIDRDRGRRRAERMRGELNECFASRYQEVRAEGGDHEEALNKASFFAALRHFDGALVSDTRVLAPTGP